MTSMLLFSSLAISAERMQAFRRANNKEVMLEAGYIFIQSKASIKSLGTTYNSDNSQTSAIVTGEFGVTEDIAIGTSIAKIHSDGEEGLDDYNIHIKGQYQDFFYTATYFISPGDQENDNFYSGGNYYSLSLGYQLTSSFAVQAAITPEYDFKFKNDTTDYVSGTSYQLNAFYEHKVNNKDVLGFSGGFLYSKANTDDGETYSDDTRYATLQVYYNAFMYGLELNPSLAYMNYMSFNDDTKATITLLNLMIRKRF